MINSCNCTRLGGLAQSNAKAASRTQIALAISLAVASFSVESLAASDSGLQQGSAEHSQPLLSARSTIMLQDPAGPDSDGDGVRNQDDLDDDNDGILDSLEGGVDNDGDGFPDNNSNDTDGDGTPDVLDLDSDNDGILDNLEARLSREAVKALDWVPNGAIDIGVPVGGNGVADPIETWPESGVLKFPIPDTDQDGIPDFRDLDSDNDGIYDVVEAGGSDNDTDGRIDGFFDEDGKGVADIVQAVALPIFDTDGDGQLDFRDLDSDADTVPDRLEAGGNPSFPADSDSDGAPDYRESDSDADGIGDRQEAGDIPGSLIDSDGDGIADLRDADSNPLSGGAADESVTDPDSEEQGSSVDQPVDQSASQDDPQNDPINVNDGKPDRDADGIANQEDLDDDNDSILDSQEGIVDADGNGVADASSRDSDGDGTPDGNDLDSDNDGILDLIEARLDAQTIATLDRVNNGAIDTTVFVGANGVADSIETAPDSGEIAAPLLDTDSDGTPDFMDVDSDNDSISDLIEAGGMDIDNDGRVDNFIDADAKGVDDAVQANALPRFDTDGDGLPDYRDLDSDGDGIPDGVERRGSGSFLPADTDADGAADYREQDSDNDGVPDSVEVGLNLLQPDDSNGDGIPDFQDADTQNQGNAGPVDPVDPPEVADHDNDGQSDSIDLDDDNDGLSDIEEGNGDSDSDGVVNSLDRDSDNDGVLDSREAFVRDPVTGNLTAIVADTDADSIPDYLDLDSDNDGIFDSLEANRDAISSSGRLASAVDVDAFGLAAGAHDRLSDTDKDGVADMIDLDSDNDGLLDVLEAQNADSDLDGRIDSFTDLNSDGADDSLEGNAVQLIDTDMDRIADVRDLDSDQDGLSDLVENYGAAFDLDNNGLLDNFVDANGDGLDDNVAASLAPLTDTDNDGLPNCIDLDSDGDGVSDISEAGGVDSNDDSKNDLLQDSDGDGVADGVDSDVTGGVDLDGDSIDDRFDSDFVVGDDSDGDGIVDSADSDSDGNGFAGPLDDADGGLSQGEPLNLPDTDGDGIPDTQQGAAVSGDIETGLGGSGFGCSIATYRSAAEAGRIDPLLTLLLGGSVLMIALRMRRRQLAKTVLILSASALSACGTLGVNIDKADVNQRFYAGVGLLASQVEPDTGRVVGVSVDDSMSGGASIAVGYDLGNRLSVEGHLADLGQATLNPAGSIDYRVGGVSALLYGLNDSRERVNREGFSVFGRLGVGALSNDASGVEFKRVNDFHLLAGAGMEYGLSNGIGVRAELVAHETDAKYAQLGLIYRFGNNNNARVNKPAPAPVVESAIVPAVSLNDVPAKVEPAPSADAITEVDIDGDGVMDSTDECLTTEASVPVRPNGCNLFEGAIEGVEFQPASDTLTVAAIDVLSSVAQTLLEYPDVRITIEAHTDNLGDATANLQLSKRRAIAVARFLVDQGVSGSRMRPQAYGESEPRSSNETVQGRASNRRVEFSILK